MSRDLVWGSLSLKLKLQAFSTPISVFRDILIRVVRLTARVKMIKPRFYVESQIWKKTPIYFVSGTTIQHYIVPSLKAVFLL